MNGDRYETTAKKIAERLDVSYGKATNIVRTETHRVQESGLMDGAKDIANALDESELIYTATWRTMKDERVRPQQRYHTKSGWKTSMRGTADHMKMDGVTIKVGDKFKLEPNVYAECPGMSGTARNDCRCRCYLDYDLMTEEEFNALENKQINGFDSETAVNSVDKQGESGIIEEKSFEVAGKDLHYIGKIDVDKYKCITNDIATDEVIITNERIQHIKEGHSGDFEEIHPHFQEILKSPDYILEDSSRKNTGLVLKQFTQNNLRVQMVLRVHTSTDKKGYKNSIISAWKISESRWQNYLKNKKILYKSE